MRPALERVLEPWVIDGGVVDHEVHDDLDAALVGRGDERPEGGLVAVVGLDGGVVGDVVAVVAGGLRDRHEPDAADAEVLQVVQLRGRAREVADPVTVRIREAADEELVPGAGGPRRLRQPRGRSHRQRPVGTHETTVGPGVAAAPCVGSGAADDTGPQPTSSAVSRDAPSPASFVRPSPSPRVWRSLRRMPETPAWVRDAVFYQIFPDRFASSDRVPKPGPLEPWDSPPTNYGFTPCTLVAKFPGSTYAIEATNAGPSIISVARTRPRASSRSSALASSASASGRPPPAAPSSTGTGPPGGGVTARAFRSRSASRVRARRRSDARARRSARTPAHRTAGDR